MRHRGIPTSKKLEKQRFGMPRRAARKKNWLSGCPETPKNGKMKRRGGRRAKNQKNDVSAIADDAKTRFRPRPKPQKLAGRKTALALPFQLRNVYLLSHLEICNAGVDGLDITIHSRP